MPLEDSGQEVVLNGIASNATKVRLRYEAYIGSTLDETATTTPVDISWGSPYNPAGQQFWRIDVSNVGDLFWQIDVNDPFTQVIVTNVQITDDSGDVIADKQVVDDPFDESERRTFDRSGEFIIEELTIAVQ